ncbi:MAG: hypothetical protein A2W80_11035 [Candidatus Riflebacteria bacterium GWC2_50_8]|nr:MAG: hypothetical protein A2W80_11035 [Candidatus Riflebacteria bacterium GWC2_50_8]
MLKKYLTLVAMLLLSCSLLAQAGSPFAVDSATSDAKASVIATSSAESGNNGDAASKQARKGLLAAIIEFLKELSGGFSTKSKAGADIVNTLERSLVNTQQQEKRAGPTVKSTIASATAAVERKAAALKAKIPQLVKHESAGGKSISVGSAQFKSWFAEAAKFSSSWKFPDVTNKYGQKISREDYLRAIIWIESRGVHQNNRGSITKSWAGAVGFMQLMPNTARGLKVTASDAAQNLKGGAKYLSEIFNSGSVSKKTGAEKLIMGACAYNLGPFSKSMKKSWEQLKTAKIPVETRSYGLKMKMALGLELSADEKKLADQWFVPKGQTVDEFTDEFYANAQGIAR